MAELQHDIADYERGAAALERRWAELTDRVEPNTPPHPAELVRRHTRERAKQLSVALARTAAALDRSAELADEHAQRAETTRRDQDGAKEREVAGKTRAAAERARAQADEWQKISEA